MIVATFRRPTWWVVAILLGLMLWARSAAAQDGSCPPNTYELGGVSGFPSHDIVCAHQLSTIRLQVDDADDYPCSQFVRRDEASLPYSDMVTVVQDVDTWLSDVARARFLVFTVPKNPTQGLVPPGVEFVGTKIRVNYMDSNGDLYSWSETDISAYHYATRYFNNSYGMNQYYNIYLVDMFLATDDGYGGYFTIDIDQDPLQDGGYVPNVDWGIAGFRSGSHQAFFGDICEYTVPDPATPTPAPTWTPSGVNTPTPMTTPAPTSAGGTPIPTWTPTVIIYPTLPSEATATPWPIPPLSTIAWPTVPAIDTAEPAAAAFVEVTEMEEGRATRAWDMADQADEIATRFSEPVNWAQSQMSDTATTSGITGTVAISSTGQSFAGIIENMAMPVRFVRTVRVYMPNIWPVLATMLGAFFIIVGYYVGKLAMMIIGNLVEVIRRIWEAIPLN